MGVAIFVVLIFIVSENPENLIRLVKFGIHLRRIYVEKTRDKPSKNWEKLGTMDYGNEKTSLTKFNKWKEPARNWVLGGIWLGTGKKHGKNWVKHL